MSLTARIVPVALAATAATSCRGAPLHGVVIENPHAAPALSVVRATGDRYTLATDTGKLVLLYFGYTHCPDFCPMMLTDWKRVRHDLGALADGVRFVFVSVDPDRDSPEHTETYVHGFDSSFVGLAPPQAELDMIKKAWGVASYKEAVIPGRPADSYSVAHPAEAFLVDRAGRLMAMYPPATRWQDVAADLRTLR